MILALFVTTYIGGIIGEFKRGRIRGAKKKGGRREADRPSPC